MFSWSGYHREQHIQHILSHLGTRSTESRCGMVHLWGGDLWGRSCVMTFFYLLIFQAVLHSSWLLDITEDYFYVFMCSFSSHPPSLHPSLPPPLCVCVFMFMNCAHAYQCVQARRQLQIPIFRTSPPCFCEKLFVLELKQSRMTSQWD